MGMRPLSPTERDFYEERRRKWRRSAFWRGFLVAIGLLILVGVVGIFASDRPFGPHIARVELTGTLYDDAARLRMLRGLEENEDVRAVIVQINSPGGTSAGSEAIHDTLRRVAETKPVVAVLGEVAASGGYIAAIGADHIIARGNTLTGSIGVILEYPDVTGLLDRIGIEFETFRSSEAKAELSPFREISPAARERQQALIADGYAWFRDLVGARRGLTGPALERVATGAVFTGRSAEALGLIDALGGEPEAIDYLESRDPTLEDLDITTWRSERDSDGWPGLLSRFLVGERGLSAWPATIGPSLMAIYK